MSFGDGERFNEDDQIMNYNTRSETMGVEVTVESSAMARDTSTTIHGWGTGCLVMLILCLAVGCSSESRISDGKLEAIPSPLTESMPTGMSEKEQKDFKELQAYLRSQGVELHNADGLTTAPKEFWDDLDRRKGITPSTRNRKARETRILVFDE